MEGFARQKLYGGKMVYVRVDYNDKFIERVQIFGDFLLYPEEGIAKMEKSLSGIAVGESVEQISERIRSVIVLNKMDLIGMTPVAIAQTVKSAVEK